MKQLTPSPHARVVHIEPGVIQLYGTRDDLDQVVDEARRRGVLVRATMVRPTRALGIYTQAMVLRLDDDEPVDLPAIEPQPWYRRPRFLVAVVAAAIGSLIVVGWLLYLAVAAALSAATAAAKAIAPAAGAVAFVVFVGWLLLGQAGACPGLHCPGCKCGGR